MKTGEIYKLNIPIEDTIGAVLPTRIHLVKYISEIDKYEFLPTQIQNIMSLMPRAYIIKYYHKEV